MDLADALPEDVLADVLGRLAPRWLAASGCVCRSWRAAVDSRGLLRADLLPRSVAGLFLQHSDDWMGCLLSRPSAGPVVSADLAYTFSPGAGNNKLEDSFKVEGHCNGLVLLQDRVVNPATRQWARLPPQPPAPAYFYTDVYLVYDPAVSPHYEVLSVPRVRRKNEMFRSNGGPPPREEGLRGVTYNELDPAVEQLEWPPSPLVLHVFSSRTGRWEERSFVRQGPAAGTVADMRPDVFVHQRHGVYWRGALYVECQNDFIMRLSLSDDTYQLIQPPVAFEPSSLYDLYYGDWTARKLSIGKSKEGVYCVLIDKKSQIKVWILTNDDDSAGAAAAGHQQMKWVPKQLGGQLPELQTKTSYYELQSHGPWALQDLTSQVYDTPEKAAEYAVPQGRFDWDSDDDNLLPDNGDRTGYKRYIAFLGFHPYKEVIFLDDSLVRVLAYHLDTSKIQDLGYVYPEEERQWLGNQHVRVDASFPYTPCWMGDLPQNPMIS